MSTLVTRPAPDFTAKAVLANSAFGDFTLSALKGKYVLLFFYPLDFTFVCPSEIIAFDKKIEEFRKRNTEVVAVSVDSEFAHFAWKNTERKQGGIGNVQFPLVADITKSISKAYGILMDDAVALRGLFLIDRQGIIRHALVNDLPLGRNVDEAIRMIDALQFFEEHGDVCPANWRPGEEGMKASSEGVAEYLAKHS